MVMNELQIMEQEKSNSGTSVTKNNDFERDGYLKLENILDAEELYHPVPRERGQLNYRGSLENFVHQPDELQVPGSLARYGHPQYKIIHNNLRKKLEKIIGCPLFLSLIHI